jgi:hypothetical protein
MFALGAFRIGSTPIFMIFFFKEKWLSGLKR